jgi:hypothetical protein
MTNTNFSSDQLQALRVEFSKIDRVCADRLPEFHALFADCEDSALLQLAAAKVKFVSKLAVNAASRRGLL